MIPPSLLLPRLWRMRKHFIVPVQTAPFRRSCKHCRQYFAVCAGARRYFFLLLFSLRVNFRGSRFVFLFARRVYRFQCCAGQCSVHHAVWTRPALSIAAAPAAAAACALQKGRFESERGLLASQASPGTSPTPVPAVHKLVCRLLFSALER